MNEDMKMIKRRRRRKTGILYFFVVIILAAAVIIAGIGIFFRVAIIEVVGNKLCTADEILQVSGFETGESMILTNTSSARKKIMNAFSSVENVNIRKKYPDKLLIEITESYPIASVKSGSDYWLIDKNARLMSKTDSGGTKDTIAVSGVEPINPTTGTTAALGQKDGPKLTYLKAVLSAILSEEMENSVSWMDMSNIGDITFDYLGRFTVHLGKGENVNEKMILLKKIAATYEDSVTGRIDLSIDGEAHVIPE